MKLTCTGADLHRAAAWAAKIAPSNPASPVMAGVLITAGDTLTLAASDLETFGTATVSGAVVQQDGRAVVNARFLAAIAEVVPDSAELTIVLEGSPLEISSGRSRWKLPTMEVDLWPSFPDVGEPIGEIEGSVLESGMNRVLPACGAPDIDPRILGGVLVEFSDRLTLTATDRYRAATAKLPWQPALGEHEQVVVPPSVLKHVKIGSMVTIGADASNICLRSGDFTLIGRLMAGKYLAVHKLLDTPVANSVGTVTLDVKELGKAINEVSVVLKANAQLLISFSEVGVVVTNVSEGNIDDPGSDAELGVIECAAPEIQVKIKQSTIADALKCLGSESVVLTFGGKNVKGEAVDPGTQAFLAQPANSNGKQVDMSYSHLLMPMSKKPGKS